MVIASLMLYRVIINVMYTRHNKKIFILSKGLSLDPLGFFLLLTTPWEGFTEIPFGGFSVTCQLGSVQQNVSQALGEVLKKSKERRSLSAV